MRHLVSLLLVAAGIAAIFMAILGDENNASASQATMSTGKPGASGDYRLGLPYDSLKAGIIQHQCIGSTYRDYKIIHQSNAETFASELNGAIAQGYIVQGELQTERHSTDAKGFEYIQLVAKPQ